MSTIQKTIAKIVKKEEQEAKGKKSSQSKVTDLKLPIITMSGLTQ